MEQLRQRTSGQVWRCASFCPWVICWHTRLHKWFFFATPFSHFLPAPFAPWKRLSRPSSFFKRTKGFLAPTSVLFSLHLSSPARTTATMRLFAAAALVVISVFVGPVASNEACGTSMARISIDGGGEETGPTCSSDEVCCFHVAARLNDHAGAGLAISCVAGSSEEQCQTCAKGYGGSGFGECRCSVESCGSGKQHDPNNPGRVLVEGNMTCIRCGAGPFCPWRTDSGPGECDSHALGWLLIGLSPVPFLLAAAVVAISIRRRLNWCVVGTQLGFLLPLLVLSLVLLGFPNYCAPRFLLPIGCVIFLSVSFCTVRGPSTSSSELPPESQSELQPSPDAGLLSTDHESDEYSSTSDG
jgi:hypothetical protein